jgi:hypothetical protein
VKPYTPECADPPNGFTERDLRSERRNRKDFAGFSIQDDGHVFVVDGQRKIRRQEAGFGFVEDLVVNNVFNFSAPTGLFFWICVRVWRLLLLRLI